MAERQRGESDESRAGSSSDAVSSSDDATDPRQRIAQLEAELRDARALYATLVDTVPFYVFRKDTEGRTTFGNKLYCDSLAIPLDELIGMYDAELFPQKLAEKYRHDDLKVIDSGETFHDIEEHTNPDGMTSYVEVFKTPVRDGAREIIGVQGIYRDITAQKGAEAALGDSQARYNSLMESLPLSVWSKDLEGRFTFANRLFCENLDRPLDELVGRSDFDFFPSDLAEKYRADDRRVAESGTVLEDIEEFQSADGHQSYVQVLKAPVHDAQGDIVGTQGMSWDVTVRRQAEVALERAKQAAEDANRAKSQFLANMSHEIRTPLNGVIGMTDLIMATQLTADQREHLSLVQESAESLLDVINDILDFSKIEAGKLDLDNIPFAVRDSIGDAMRLLSVRAHNKGLELAYRIPPQIPIALRGDPGRLRQVLLNLVGNAIKFTEKGEVVVQVELIEETDSGVDLRFSVRDTGIGIPPEKQKTIFEAFEQADGSTTRKYGGTGLGLAVSARLVELMGGRVSVDSEQGKGSTFSFTAHFGTADAAEAAVVPLDADELRDLKVLIVDDNSTNRLILVEMLNSWNMQPEAVESGPAALAALWTALESGAPHRLILCDGNMPSMDGFALARRINDTLEFDRPVLIMLTSGGMVNHAEIRDELRLAACLIKPVKQSDLFDAVATAMAGGDQPSSEAATTQGFEQSDTVSRHILLAEDSIVNQKLAVGLLERRGHTVVVAQNGLEALDLFGREAFDVVLMDVQMPDMDGLEATAAIRQKEAISGHHIPIIAMTAHAMQGDRERCLAAGMDDYLAKPIRAAGLFAAIESAVGSRDAAASAAKDDAAKDETTTGEVADTSSTATENVIAENVIDWAEAFDRVGEDEELLRDVTDAFLQESPTLLADLGQAIETGDVKLMQRSAHTLKTSFGHFGAGDAARLAQEIETLGAAGETDGARELNDRLQAPARAVLAALQLYYDEGKKT